MCRFSLARRSFELKLKVPSSHLKHSTNFDDIMSSIRRDDNDDVHKNVAGPLSNTLLGRLYRYVDRGSVRIFSLMGGDSSISGENYHFIFLLTSLVHREATPLLWLVPQISARKDVIVSGNRTHFGNLGPSRCKTAEDLANGRRPGQARAPFCDQTKDSADLLRSNVGKPLNFEAGRRRCGIASSFVGNR